MDLFCNGEQLGAVESVEWKEQADEGGRVTFMVPFDVDWPTCRRGFVELADGADGQRYMIKRITRVDEGSTGDFVVAEYKPL